MENENDDELKLIQEKRDFYNKNRREKRLLDNGGIKLKCGRKAKLLIDMSDEEKELYLEKKRHKNIKNLVANACSILDKYKTHLSMNTYKKIYNITKYLDDNGVRR
jgi:hypothetical protein